MHECCPAVPVTLIHIESIRTAIGQPRCCERVDGICLAQLRSLNELTPALDTRPPPEMGPANGMLSRNCPGYAG